MDWDSLPDEWALEPNQILVGTGIMSAAAARDDEWGGWRISSGWHLPPLPVRDHVRLILEGIPPLAGSTRRCSSR